MTSTVADLLRERVTAALDLARMHVYDGDHHKDWVMDQVVRTLLGCPVETVQAADVNGVPHTFEKLGSNEAYLWFVSEAEAGPFEWDEGVAP